MLLKSREGCGIQSAVPARLAKVIPPDMVILEKKFYPNSAAAVVHEHEEVGYMVSELEPKCH